MTDSPNGTVHRVRHSIPGAFPPLPERGGEHLDISLGYVAPGGSGLRARIYTGPAGVENSVTVTHEDLCAGDLFSCRAWRFEVLRLSLEDGAELRLLPESRHD